MKSFDSNCPFSLTVTNFVVKMVLGFGGKIEKFKEYKKTIQKSYDVVSQEMDFAGLMMTRWLTLRMSRLSQDTAANIRGKLTAL